MFETLLFAAGAKLCGKSLTHSSYGMVFFPKQSALSLDRERKSPMMQKIRNMLLNAYLQVEDLPVHQGTRRLSAQCDGKTQHH